jgi:hypothetical protein
MGQILARAGLNRLIHYRTKFLLVVLTFCLVSYAYLFVNLTPNPRIVQPAEVDDLHRLRAWRTAKNSRSQENGVLKLASSESEIRPPIFTDIPPIVHRPNPTGPFKVTRDIFHILEKLQVEPDPDEEGRPYLVYGHDSDTNVPGVGGQIRWPPIVTRIPEPTSQKSPNSVGYLRALCGSPCSLACQFVMPVYIDATDIFRFQTHDTVDITPLLHVASLSLHTNRLLILPNLDLDLNREKNWGARTRMNLCARLDFSFYFDSEPFVQQLKARGVHAVTMKVFKKWLNEGQGIKCRALEGQVAHVISPEMQSEAGMGSEHALISRDVGPNGAYRISPSCLKSRFNGHVELAQAPLFAYLPVQYLENNNRTSIGSLLADALHSEPHSGSSTPEPKDRIPEPDPDILLVSWSLPSSSINGPHQSLPDPSEFTGVQINYTPSFLALANKIAPEPPHVVLQWRMEGLDPDRLVECADAMMWRLADIIYALGLFDASDSSTGSEGGREIWLLSDYPLPVRGAGASVRTQGMLRQVKKLGLAVKSLKEGHIRAMETVTSAFVADDGELAKWDLMDVFGAVERALVTKIAMQEDVGVLKDPGAVAIVERIITSKAEVVVNGNIGWCSK